MTPLERALKESQNIYSSMARGIATRLYDVRKELIKDSLHGFENNAHRLEDVATIRGISFINDSRATNVNATWYALETLRGPVIWIAGGLESHNDYSILDDDTIGKVKALICIGSNNNHLVSSFRDKVEFIVEAGTMSDAVTMAYNFGRPGDTVLLSPAAASFDRFENYADRGNQFKKAVYDL